jgi:hypothetical protein
MVKYTNYKDPAVAARMMVKLRDVFDGRRFATTPDGINSATVASALGITKRVGVHFCELYRRERETAERSAKATPKPAAWIGGSKLFRVVGSRLFVLDSCQCRAVPPKRRPAWCEHCDGVGLLEREVTANNPVTQARRDYAKILAEQYQDRLADRIREARIRKQSQRAHELESDDLYPTVRRRGRPRKYDRTRFAW